MDEELLVTVENASAVRRHNADGQLALAVVRFRVATSELAASLPELRRAQGEQLWVLTTSRSAPRISISRL